MKIVTLCGCGLGTSYILKITAERALREIGMNACIVPCDIGSCSSEKADLYLAPYGLNSPLGVTEHMHIVAIHNIVSVPEVRTAIEALLSSD